MTQEIILGVLFGLATLFVARKLYRDFTSKGDCAKGCGTCDTAKNKV